MKNRSRNGKAIRVLVVHEERLCREGIRQICALAEDIQVAGDLADVRSAVATAETLKPDVALMNAGSRWIDTIDAVQGLLAQQPFVHIILITRVMHDPLVAHMRNLGIAGCISKNSQPEELLEAIRAAAQGMPLPDIKDDADSGSLHPHMPALTGGETLVLSLVARGADNRTIAHQLKLSEQTVANRLQVVYEKLGVNSRVQATLLALKHGWVPLDV